MSERHETPDRGTPAGGTPSIGVPEGLTFEATMPADPRAAALIAELDASLLEHYPPEEIYPLSPAEMRDFPGVFLIACDGERPVACGAIRPLSDTVGELKRMFVRPEARGRGVAAAMLRELERVAVQRGWTTLRLETGTAQLAAIRLYERAGYSRIACFGAYAGGRWSVCFEKTLAGAVGRAGS